MDASQRLSAKQALQHPWLKVSPRKESPVLLATCWPWHAVRPAGSMTPVAFPLHMLWHACSTVLPAGTVKQPLNGCVVTLSSA